MGSYMHPSGVNMEGLLLYNLVLVQNGTFRKLGYFILGSL